MLHKQGQQQVQEAARSCPGAEESGRGVKYVFAIDASVERGREGGWRGVEEKKKKKCLVV